MKHEIKKVEEFHKESLQPIGYNPQPIAEDRSDLRIRLMQEELDEYIEAVKSKNLVEVADALADLQYVLYGTVVEHGMQNHFNAIFSTVHQSNMTKVADGMKLDPGGKIMKPEGFEPPKIKEVILEDYSQELVWKKVNNIPGYLYICDGVLYHDAVGMALGVVNLCPCGEGDKLVQQLYDGLVLVGKVEMVHNESIDFKWEDWERLKEKRLGNFADFIFHFLDKEGMTQHGSSIPGFLVSKGEKYIEILQVALTEIRKTEES